MKVIKQKDQKYSSYQMRLETVIDRIIYSKGTRRRYMKKFNNKRYERRFYTLAHMFGNKYGRIDGLNFLACGVSHLDAAWLFPVVDTKMRAFKTFYMAVEHCEEFPFFTFSQTTPQYYDWIRVYWPELWEKVREKVKQGRIELTGGMWVEPDLDMPCGESLVRQRLYGQLFFLKYFGFYPTMESLLDVFGFPWSLPQILVKSGATSFWTTKDSGGLPMNTCYWQGIDGTQIFMHQFTYNWDSMTSLNSFKRKARFPKKEFERTELNSHLTGAEIQSRFSENPAHMNPNFPFFYGLGDGGRGPLEFEIMWADAFVKNYSGRHVSQHEIMEIMKESMGDQYFIWNDEKYLGYHRGTKTTQNLVKHLNRRAECWALAAETIQTLTALISPDTASIDKTIVFDMWQKILFNQFHDILPGSSIPDVYVLTKKELEAAIKIARGMIHDSLAQFQIGSDEILIFNPYNWERSEYLEISGKLYYVNSVPGLAMQKYKLTALACGSDTVPKFQEEVYNHGPSSKDLACYSIENEYIKALFDRKTGEILSIAHNATQSEVIQLDYGKLHSPTTPSSKLWRSGLRVFWENPTRWKAWNLDVRYPLNIIPIDSNDPPEILTNSNGVEELRTTFRFRKSMVTVKFSLREKDKWLKMEIDSDIRDPEILVKYFIPINLKSEDVTSDIPYANIARRRVKRTHKEKAKWEMNMQKWLDISDPDAGLSILNNNRYGFSATKYGVYLTLTRTPKYPGVSILYGSTRVLPPVQRPKYTDIKPFTYKFALLPHTGDWKAEHVWQIAQDFNFPLANTSYLGGETETGDIHPIEGQLIKVSHPNVMAGAVKPSEWTGDNYNLLPDHRDWAWDHKTIIVRLVELEGQDCTVTLSLNSQFRLFSVVEINLLEMDTRPLVKFDHSSFCCEMGHYEIKTFRIKIE